MVVITYELVQAKAKVAYAKIIAQRATKYAKGQRATKEEDQTKILATIVRFAPYWDLNFLKKADNYLQWLG